MERKRNWETEEGMEVGKGEREGEREKDRARELEGVERKMNWES